MRLTKELLHEFDKEYGTGTAYLCTRIKDNGRPEYVMNSGWEVPNPGRSHLALAYLYGRFRALGAKPLLSDAWVERVKEAYARDRKNWYLWEQTGFSTVAAWEEREYATS